MSGYVVCDSDIPREKLLNYMYLQIDQDSDQMLFCGRSGSAFFASYPFWGLQTKLDYKAKQNF